jgi:hypothetical protein
VYCYSPTCTVSLSNLRMFKIHGKEQKVGSVLFKMHPAWFRQLFVHRKQVRKRMHTWKFLMFSHIFAYYVRKLTVKEGCALNMYPLCSVCLYKLGVSFSLLYICIIFINCNWAVTRWQWIFYMYTSIWSWLLIDLHLSREGYMRSM